MKCGAEICVKMLALLLYLLGIGSFPVIGTPISITLGPVNTIAEVGDIVPCDCRYTGTEDLPLWRINGVVHLPSALPLGYMANRTGLYFQAHLLLHQTTYQCLFALYNDSSESIETIESTTGTLFVRQGQPIPLHAAARVEEPMEIGINVTEGGNVTFQCAMITATPTLNVRFPGEPFGTTLPTNLREDDELTFTLVNVSQSNNGTEFQCRGGGAETDIGVISVQSSNFLLAFCDIKFVEAFIENPTIQLQWNPVNTSAPECPDNAWYNVSYRNCNDMTLHLTECTANTSITFHLDKEEFGTENYALFSVQVEGSNYLTSKMTVNLENNTELIIAVPGAVIQIQVEGTVCNTLGEFCIAPGGSNSQCYGLRSDESILEGMNYTYTECSNFLFCLQTTVTSTMNETLYTAFCYRSRCGFDAISLVAATSKLIVATPPSQPEKPCLYFNGTHIILCVEELPFSHLPITAWTIQVTSTCNKTNIINIDLCELIPVSNIVNITDDCQPVNVSITAHSNAGASQPSPVTVIGNRDFCLCVAKSSGQNITGDARYISQSESSVRFKIVQTNPLPPRLSINFCNGSVDITIESANGQSNTFSQMWDRSSCDFKNGQAQISVGIDNFPESTAGENYTVIFNISLNFDGVTDLCYLQLEVSNITVTEGSDQNSGLLGLLALFILPIYIIIIGIIICYLERRNLRNCIQ